jgi:hypothetical protein
MTMRFIIVKLIKSQSVLPYPNFWWGPLRGWARSASQASAVCVVVSRAFVWFGGERCWHLGSGLYASSFAEFGLLGGEARRGQNRPKPKDHKDGLPLGSVISDALFYAMEAKD